MNTTINNGAEYAPLAIYVHIPFCVRKCRYCDFFSCTGKCEKDYESYVNLVCDEIKAKGAVYKDDYYVDTIFFGGGTPSLLSADQLARILRCIDECFVVGCINARTCGAGLKSCDGLEISCEANPGTVDKEKLEAMKNAGFNRISFGVQSFDDGVLEKLGRIHDAQEAERAVILAKELGFNTNLDLMFGVPGQSLEIWEETVRKAIELSPEHISFYSLQLEEGTPLYEEYRYGGLEIPSWEDNRRMYHSALDAFIRAGYEHYEISNLAKPGYRCKHNLKYWTMSDYLGFGPAAHSYIKGKRVYNTEDICGWESTEDEDKDKKGDYIFTRLRLIEGFPLEEYKQLFGRDFLEEFEGFFDPELLTEENGYIKLTKKGLDYTNPVMAKLLEKV